MIPPPRSLFLFGRIGQVYSGGVNDASYWPRRMRVENTRRIASVTAGRRRASVGHFESPKRRKTRRCFLWVYVTPRALPRYNSSRSKRKVAPILAVCSAAPRECGPSSSQQTPLSLSLSLFLSFSLPSLLSAHPPRLLYFCLSLPPRLSYTTNRPLPSSTSLPDFAVSSPFPAVLLGCWLCRVTPNLTPGQSEPEPANPVIPVSHPLDPLCSFQQSRIQPLLTPRDTFPRAFVAGAHFCTSFPLFAGPRRCLSSFPASTTRQLHDQL